MDVYTILWADLMIMKRRMTKYLITTLVSPILYLFAFGWGLGRGINIEGANYLDFVIPGIIALTAMNSSFIGAGARLNVDRLFFRSFDEFLMAPISAISLIFGKAMIGAFRGMVSSVAFLALAFLLSPTFSLGPLFLIFGGSRGPSGQVP
jgi:ABC-2 type transport system permease protein